MWCVGGIIRIPKKGHARDAGNSLLEKLQPFCGYLRAKDGIPSDIPTRPSEALRKPGLHRIADPDHDDGDRRRRLLGCDGGWCAKCDNDGHRDADQFGYRRSKPVGLALGSSIFNGDVPAFQIAEVAQALAEGVPHRRVVDNANARDYRCLLRTRCKRPSRHCAAEKRDEPAALHIRPSGEGIVTAQTRTWIGVQTPIKRISVGTR